MSRSNDVEGAQTGRAFQAAFTRHVPTLSAANLIHNSRLPLTRPSGTGCGISGIVRFMNGPIDPSLHEHYALGKERDRLAEARGILEFERTKEIVLRHLPAPPAVVADIGGGPGRYALWLAERGHRVEHRDRMPLHVDQLRAVADPTRINAAVGDARDLDLNDGAVDAVLLLGPVYHLRRRDQRMLTLREAWRVVRPGGLLFVAAISRWAPRLDGELRARLYESLPAIREETPRVERSGWMPPLFPGSFSA